LNINISFTDVVTQKSTGAKFFKEILSNHKELEDVQMVTLTEEMSVFIMNKLSPKFKDIGRFTILYSIESVNTYQDLWDLDASVSLMPKLFF
jgi:hypothetical protein